MVYNCAVNKYVKFRINETYRDIFRVYISQQIQNICIPFKQRRTNVFDVGPTLYKCYTDVLCWLEYTISHTGNRKCSKSGDTCIFRLNADVIKSLSRGDSRVTDTV